MSDIPTPSFKLPNPRTIPFANVCINGVVVLSIDITHWPYEVIKTRTWGTLTKEQKNIAIQDLEIRLREVIRVLKEMK